MRVLLDTCVISEVRRPGGSPKVRAAVEAILESDLFISVITIGELAKGITLLPSGRRKDELQAWLAAIMRQAAGRILPVTMATAQIWGELSAAAASRGLQVPVSDGLIAATARQHDLVLMTRNTADFAPTGVELMNPWE